MRTASTFSTITLTATTKASERPEAQRPGAPRGLEGHEWTQELEKAGPPSGLRKTSGHIQRGGQGRLYG